jgi:hypothetical protein
VCIIQESLHADSASPRAACAVLPVYRLQRQLLVQPSTVTDAELATWMQPLLYLAADAAAAAAAAAAASSSSVDAAPAAAGVGMMGSAAGAADLALADAAMSTLAAAVAVGGPLVKVRAMQQATKRCRLPAWPICGSVCVSRADDARCAV